MTRVPETEAVPAWDGLSDIRECAQNLVSRIILVESAQSDTTNASLLEDMKQACLAFDAALKPAENTVNGLIDRTVFDRLMNLAGPDTAPDLLDRLDEDLQSVREELRAAQRLSDAQMLRTQSHILIGLAGAVGAEALRIQAKNLNDGVHAAGDGQFDLVLTRLMPPLDALIRFVQAQRAMPGALS